MGAISSLRRFLDRVARRVASLGIARRKITERFFEYGISTGLTTALEFLLLFVLVTYFSVFYLWAATIAFFTKVTILFFLIRYTAFRDQHPDTKTAYVKFFGIYTMNLMIILIFMTIAVELLGIHYLLARGVTLFFMVFWSFWLNAKFNFKLLK